MADQPTPTSSALDPIVQAVSPLLASSPYGPLIMAAAPFAEQLVSGFLSLFHITLTPVIAPAPVVTATTAASTPTTAASPVPSQADILSILTRIAATLDQVVVNTTPKAA